MPYFANFEIDIVSALAEQLVEALDRLAAAPLHPALTSKLPAGRGVYALEHQNTLVYVGKADDISLPDRLDEHHYKIGGRRNINVNDVSFKCLYVHKNWNALAPERSLIDHYKKHHKACTWNGGGFGPHDPGRNREETNKAPGGFDATYPIIDDLPCRFLSAGTYNALDLLLALKENLPYLLRYQASHYLSGHPDYNSTTVHVPHSSMPAKEVLRLIARAVPGWQATVFPGHMIFYKESRAYVHGTVL